ncbi:MAG TPA: hypothetical protein VGE52_13665, partial [Pirellulales bacterium]
AQARLEELKVIDPETYRRSMVYSAFKASPKPGTESGPNGAAPAPTPPGNAAPAGEAKAAPATKTEAAPKAVN